MCFNKTTQVTNTGLGDDQYNQIQANQTGLATQSQEGFGAVGTGINTLSSDLGTVSGNLTGLTNTANTEFGNINNALTGLGTSMTTNADAAGNSREQYYNSLLAQMNSNTGGLQTSLDTGFDGANSRFDALDTGVGGVQSAVDTGFSTAGTRFDTLDTNVGNVQSAVDDGFVANTANVDALQNTADEFTSTFDTFSDRYTQDETLAQKSRSDLALSQAGEAERTRADLAGFVSGTNQGFADVQAGQVANQNETINELGNMAKGASAAQNETMQQFQNIDSGQVVQLRNLAQVAANQEGLDADMRNDFNQLGQAYDDNGDLIKSSIDAQGNTITRAIDNQGMMMLNSFDVTGQKLSQKVIDVGARVTQLSDYSQATMGNLTPANSGTGVNSGSGLYTQTG